MVQHLLERFSSDNPGVRTNLYRLFTHGKLGGSNKLTILAVDQGFEHGPDKSFAMNAEAYDPTYPFRLATLAGLSGYAAPIGLLEAAVDHFVGRVPLILKMNSGNSLMSKTQAPDQAITASIQDALRLGCVGVGFTIYPGSDNLLSQYNELREIIREAKEAGLVVVVWSYPRGNVSKTGETGLDVISYGAHMACLMGAHIVKVKLPTAHIENPEIKSYFDKHKISYNTLADRVQHVVRCCFEGKRIVIFSGGETKNVEDIYEDMRAIQKGGGFGTIMGRNCFQRSFNEALTMLSEVQHILAK